MLGAKRVREGGKMSDESQEGRGLEAIGTITKDAVINFSMNDDLLTDEAT